MKNNVIITKELIEEHHYRLRKTTDQIGRELGCSGRKVRDRMARLQLKTLGDSLKMGRPTTSNTAFHKGHTPWNKGIHTGIVPFNKGLTKKTHPSIARAAQAKLGKKRPDMCGHLHPNWKGGKTAKTIAIRNSAEYKAWRKSVFKRDNYTCQDCGKHGGRLHAHHIIHFAVSKEKRFDISNGLTLCSACHVIRHPDRPGLKHRALSIEHRRSLSEAAKARWIKPEERQKQSDRKKKQMTPELRQKISNAKKGHPSWNKGLTKETSPSIAHMAELARERTRRKHTER